jgi:spermidine/putrescine transport system ATP-binding protein
VTHDQETASAMSDRLAIMRSGRIVQVGSPSDVYHAPDSRFVADFLGDANFLTPESVQRVAQEQALVRVFDTSLTLPDPDWGEGAPAIMFRPEHVTLSTAPVEGAARGTIVSQQFKTGAYRWQVALGDGQQVTAQSSQDIARGNPIGRQVWLTIQSEHARLLRQ